MLILCPTEEDAKRELAELRVVLAQLGLRLNLEETRIVERRVGFDFFGFRYRRGSYTRGGQAREVMVKVPRPRAEQSLRNGIKEMVQRTPLGETVAEVVNGVNRQLRGWANYFRIANMVEALRGLIWFSARQLRLFLRRRYQRERSQHGRRWPDAFFHERLGLYRVERLCARD